MQADEEKTLLIRNTCMDMSIQCFGYHYIFDKRAIRFGKYVRILQIVGIVIPAVLATSLVNFRNVSWLSPFLDVLLAIVSIGGFGLSIIALISGWDNKLSYSHEASHSYNYLHDHFLRLSKFPPSTLPLLNEQYLVLNTEYRTRTQQDSKYEVSDKERRMGMRAALREYQKKCVSCKEIPESMTATNCHICGNF